MEMLEYKTSDRPTEGRIELLDIWGAPRVLDVTAWEYTHKRDQPWRLRATVSGCGAAFCRTDEDTFAAIISRRSIKANVCLHMWLNGFRHRMFVGEALVQHSRNPIFGQQSHGHFAMTINGVLSIRSV